MQFLKDRRTWIGIVLGLAFVALFLVVNQKAHAADKNAPPVTRAEAEQMFPTNPWTAFYASLGVGASTMVESGTGYGYDGQQFSGRVGADVQINRIVLGVLADAAFDHHSDFGGGTGSREYMLAARAGVLVTDSALIYGLAGERWLTTTGLSTQGITVGGGIEVSMTKHWRAAVEFDRTSYDALTGAPEQTVMGRLIFALPVR